MKYIQSIPFSPGIICVAIVAAMTPGHADELNLSRAPATNTHKPPAPNVILSVDDSGSMGYAVGGKSANKNLIRMNVLKDALRETFTEANVPNDSIRLGWMSMWGNNNTPIQPSIRVLDAEVRSNLNTWINRISANGNTPAHRMLYYAGEYLKSEPGQDNPWASIPGKTELPYLGCRRSYNVFLSDGEWNQQTEWLNSTAPVKVSDIGNYDGSDQIFPDGIFYNPKSSQLSVYADDYGAVDLSAHSSSAFYSTSYQSSTEKPQLVIDYEGEGYKCSLDTRSHKTTPYRYRCYRPTYSTYPTLSDMAFYYWSTDLQPHIKQNSDKGQYELRKQIRKSGLEEIKSGNNTLSLQEYWNPKNNPAIWPHMVMFTVGFGENAANLASPKFGQNTWDLETGAYKDLLTGVTSWGNPISGSSTTAPRRAELWHAALNSRGTFVPVHEAEDLVTAFKSILNQIISENTLPMTSVTLTASTLRRDSNMFVSSYNPADWSGAVTAYAVESETANVDTASVWNTANMMDKNSNFHSVRKIFSYDGGKGVEFKWAGLSNNQKNLLKKGGVNDTLGQERLNYLRGQAVSKNGYRQRTSIHGDIVNSKAWYHNGDSAYLNKTGKEKDSSKQTRKMVYVGANAGMLHGFNASNGEEVFAYVPLGLYDKLTELIKTDYNHHYYVDGSPFVSEVKIGADWKDYLVGTLGAGGKGYFILDVTNPASFSASDVKLDVTDTADADIGYILGEPTADQASSTRATQLTQLNDGRWAFVTGNGYNSTNQNSVLLIQYLDGTLKKLTATPSSKAVGNGLSAPRLIDLSGDGIPDVAYAGDLSGNLWKFDLTCALDGSGKAKEGNACSNDYKVAFSGKPLFTAKDTLNQAQPITTAPAFIRHTSAPGLILTFGTGQNLTNDDRTTNYQQTLYGIHDRTGWTVSTTGTVSWTTPEPDDAERAYQTSEYPIKRTELQTMSLTRTTEENDDGERVAAWKVTGEVSYFNQSSGSSTFKKGWALNLPVNKSRVLGNIEWVSGELFRVRFMVPAEGGAGGTTDLIETCEAVYSEREDYVGLFNAISGKSYKSNSTDYFGFGEDPSQGLSVFLSTGDGGLKSVTPPGVEKGEDFAAPGMIGLKPNWRQVN